MFPLDGLVHLVDEIRAGAELPGFQLWLVARAVELPGDPLGNVGSLRINWPVVIPSQVRSLFERVRERVVFAFSRDPDRGRRRRIWDAVRR